MNAIHPGTAETSLHSTSNCEHTPDRMVPIGRHTRPEEISYAVLYLASDASAMVTAHTLPIDRGMSG